jgi:hypothetical protein
MALPDRLIVRQTGTLTSLADSSGTVVREVVTVAAGADTLTHAEKSEVVYGTWKGKKLETKRPGPFEEPVRETYALEADGKRLVVRTEIPGDDRRPSRTIQRVYQRLE